MRYANCLPSKGRNIIKYLNPCYANHPFSPLYQSSPYLLSSQALRQCQVSQLLSLQHPVLISDQSRQHFSISPSRAILYTFPHYFVSWAERGTVDVIICVKGFFCFRQCSSAQFIKSSEGDWGAKEKQCQCTYSPGFFPFKSLQVS